MRGQLPASLFAIIFGALETVGGVQELVYRGIFRSETEPLVMGTIGTLAGVFLLIAGILLLLRSRHASTVIQSAACVGVPVFLILGVWKHYTSNRNFCVRLPAPGAGDWLWDRRISAVEFRFFWDPVDRCH